MKKSRKILLFDIDGTLLLAGGAGRAATEKAFLELFGLKDVWQNLDPHGKTDPLIFDEIASRTLKRPLTLEETAALSRRYEELFDFGAQTVSRFRLLPGAAELLEVLSGQERYVLGIQTGNFEKVAWQKLEKGDLRRHFCFGGFGSDSSKRHEIVQKAIQKGQRVAGEIVSKDNIYVIGDARQDVRAGKASGVKTIAVATGSVTHEELKKESPDFLLSDLTDIDLFFSALES